MRPAIFRLHSPLLQNIVCDSCIAFLPGLFVALAGLGAGGGQASSTEVAQSTNAIIYSIYAFTAFFCNVFLNTLGPRWTLAAGGLGYPIYMGAFWYFGETGQAWFPYFSGIVLGLSAGWLWATAGYVALAYSTEATRARYLGMQNVIVSIGGMIGSSIAFGLSVNSTASTGVPNSVYIAFVVLMCAAIVCAAAFLVDPGSVVRNDGTHLAAYKETTSVWLEFKESIALLKDWRLALLIPVMFTSEFPLWQASVNAYAFNLRARTLLGLLYSIAQAPGGFFLVPILDNTRFSRRTRGLMGVGVMAIVIYGTWLGKVPSLRKKITVSDPVLMRSTVDAVLYFLFGALYVSYPLLIQWTMSALTNNPRKLARLASMCELVLLDLSTSLRIPNRQGGQCCWCKFGYHPHGTL
ncbi:hypothetical protein CALVIDRAFT_588995 [Calocera viscosa TUFC12733]|uniref:MFS general substrate transporter n=1 Tax=Calocera viscosa (strain TUFC12733) TaxID=1330018 RepID=A0A167H7W4_CALVF|nr:hypothetical protein CALVIDRAFT_588995 [Calocera viscosa TUFC12733]